MAAPVPIRALPIPDDRQKHATRYPGEDKERAFVQYRACRSLRDTAKELNISVSTLAAWSREHGWVERANREDAEDVAAARTAITGKAMPALHRGIDRLVKIVDDDTAAHRDQIKAVELLGRFTGTLAAPNAGQPFAAAPSTGGRPVVSLKDLAELSPDDLAAWSEGDNEAEPTA